MHHGLQGRFLRDPHQRCSRTGSAKRPLNRASSASGPHLPFCLHLLLTVHSLVSSLILRSHLALVHKGSLGSATLESIPLQDSCRKGCYIAVCLRSRKSLAYCSACDLTASSFYFAKVVENYHVFWAVRATLRVSDF